MYDCPRRYIILFILAKIFNGIKKKSEAINGLDRVLGLIIGTCKGLIIIGVVCVIANLLQGVPAVANALDVVFDKSVVGKAIYDFVCAIYENYLANIDINTLVTNAKLMIN